MAVYQFTGAFNLTDVVTFRAWAMAVHTALTTFGWMQTADTGQVNLATVGLPATNQTFYEIWAMTDSLQPTTPIFLRVDYGCSATADTSLLMFTAGPSTNGAGLLRFSGVAARLSGSSVVQLGVQISFSGDVNRFCCFIGITAPALYSIERSHDPTGADTTVSITCLWGSVNGYSATNVYQQSIATIALGGAGPLEPGGRVCHTNATSGIWLNPDASVNLGIAPFFPILGTLQPPLLGVVCAKAADFPNAGLLFKMTHYGLPHVYMTSGSNALAPGALTANQLCMRYE